MLLSDFFKENGITFLHEKGRQTMLYRGETEDQNEAFPLHFYDVYQEDMKRESIGFTKRQKSSPEEGLFVGSYLSGRSFFAERKGDDVYFYATQGLFSPKKELLPIGVLHLSEKNDLSANQEMQSLIQSVYKHATFIYTKDCFSNQSFVYDAELYGGCLIEPGTTRFLYSFLSQRKRKVSKKFLKKEEEFLLCPDLEKEKILANAPMENHSIHYFIENISEDVYRISGCQMEDDNPIVINKMMIERKRGKIKVVMFTRDLDGSWVKPTQTIPLKKAIVGSGWTKKFTVISGKDGFLKWAIKKADESIATLVQEIEMPFYEKLISSHLSKIDEKVFRRNFSSLIAYPRKESIEEAFGLSLQQLNLLNEVDIWGSNFNKNFEKGFLILKKVVKGSKGKIRSLDPISFKKLISFIFFLHPEAKDLVSIYKKDSYQRILPIATQAFDKIENRIHELYKMTKDSPSLTWLQKENLRKSSEVVNNLPFLLKITLSTPPFLKKEQWGLLERGYRGNIYDEILFSSKDFSFSEKESFIRYLLYFTEEEKERILNFSKKDIFSTDRSYSSVIEQLKNFQFLKIFQEANQYRDLLRFAKIFSEEELDQIGISFRIAPSVIEREHDILYRLYLLKSEGISNEKILSQKEKNKNFLYEGEHFFIKIPEKSSDLMEEGKELGHCVGTYVKNVSNGSSKIFFVREKSNPDKPLCTVEVKGGTVSQIQGKLKTYPRADSVGKDKEIYDFIEQWAKEKKLSIAV